MHNRTLLISLVLIFMTSCSDSDELKQQFAKEFPSERVIEKDEIVYKLVNGYYFVKLKSSDEFNLVCKEQVFLDKGGIHTWGKLSTSEFLKFDSVIMASYSNNLKVSMISKDSSSTYLVRLTKDDAYYKDVILRDSGDSLVVISEKEW